MFPKFRRVYALQNRRGGGSIKKKPWEESWDESGEKAVERELKEELDLSVKVGGLYACHTFEYPDFIITLSVYECEMLSDFSLKEHESYAWIAPKNLNEEEWAPADADILGSLKRVFGE